MDRKALTITYLVKAFPCNYDEGYGNVSVAKKVHRGSGETYLFTSRFLWLEGSIIKNRHFFTML